MLNSLFIIFIVSFINKDNGFFSIPTTSKFSGIIGSKILNASLSQTASLIELVTSPIMELGMTIDMGDTIILAFFDDTIMAFHL